MRVEGGESPENNDESELTKSEFWQYICSILALLIFALLGYSGILKDMSSTLRLLTYASLCIIPFTYLMNAMLFSLVSTRFTKAMIIVCELMLLYFFYSRADW